MQLPNIFHSPAVRVLCGGVQERVSAWRAVSRHRPVALPAHLSEIPPRSGVTACRVMTRSFHFLITPLISAPGSAKVTTIPQSTFRNLVTENCGKVPGASSLMTSQRRSFSEVRNSDDRKKCSAALFLLPEALNSEPPARPPPSSLFN